MGIFQKLRLRTQLIIYLLLLLGLFMGGAGVYIDWQLRRLVERELASKLIVLAKMAAAEVGGVPIAGLGPGEEKSRTAGFLQRQFADFAKRAELARIVIFDANYRALFDSRGELAIGDEYVRLRFDAVEISRVRAGAATAAKFFIDDQGQPFMAAYAPLAPGNAPAAIICVEGNAASLAAVQEMRRVLFTIGGIALLGAALTASIVARRITRPLVRLQAAAAAIGRGGARRPVPKSGSPELRFLAETLEEMRQAVQQRESRQQMMLAGIAHEIRNPLGGIELFAHVLQQQAGPDLQSHIEKIRNEVRHLQQIVTDFLEYARPGAPKQRKVEVMAVLGECRQTLGEIAERVSWTIAPTAPVFALVDRDHLRRMLLNLLRNACEAVSSVETPAIQVSAGPRGGQCVVRIEDNGPGIPPAAVDKIFEPFFTTRPQGTGLGLALVRQLAVENGGGIALTRNRGGCTFELCLPLG